MELDRGVLDARPGVEFDTTTVIARFSRDLLPGWYDTGPSSTPNSAGASREVAAALRTAGFAGATGTGGTGR